LSQGVLSVPPRVHSGLEKSVKVLEFSFRNSRPLNAVEKSLTFYQLVLKIAHIDR